jgi:hypothetical protein
MVGEIVRKIDVAWPGSDTRRMCDSLSKRQASVLAQLRTGMTPLNGCLRNIKAVEPNVCGCGEAVESRELFIFHCTRWSEQREILAHGQAKTTCLVYLEVKPPQTATTGHRTWMQCELWFISPWLLNDSNATRTYKVERRGGPLTATTQKPVPY